MRAGRQSCGRGDAAVLRKQQRPAPAKARPPAPHARLQLAAVAARSQARPQQVHGKHGGGAEGVAARRQRQLSIARAAHAKVVQRDSRRVAASGQHMAVAARGAQARAARARPPPEARRGTAAAVDGRSPRRRCRAPGRCQRRAAAAAAAVAAAQVQQGQLAVHRACQHQAAARQQLHAGHDVKQLPVSGVGRLARGAAPAHRQAGGGRPAVEIQHLQPAVHGAWGEAAGRRGAAAGGQHGGPGAQQCRVGQAPRHSRPDAHCWAAVIWHPGHLRHPPLRA